MSVWWGNVYGDCTLTWLCKDRACRRRLALCRTHAGGVAEGLNGTCNCGRTSNQTASSFQSVVLMLQDLTRKKCLLSLFIVGWTRCGAKLTLISCLLIKGVKSVWHQFGVSYKAHFYILQQNSWEIIFPISKISYNIKVLTIRKVTTQI